MISPVELFSPPNIIGMIFDISDQTRLRNIKNEVICFSKSLESATEDKIYVYRPSVLYMNRWLGECVADVANYKEILIDPENAINQTISIISEADFDNKKHIFYIFDHDTPSQHRRIKRGIHSDQIYHTNINFWLINLGRPNKNIEEISSSHPNCHYFYLEYLKSSFLKEVINNVNN